MSMGQIVKDAASSESSAFNYIFTPIHASMSLVVPSPKTIPLRTLLTVMIPKTGFQICHGTLKYDKLLTLISTSSSLCECNHCIVTNTVWSVCDAVK